MAVIATQALGVPGAVLAYDVRAADSTTEPILMIAGSPMGADSFAALAERFPERTVVSHDPRGAGRSRRTDGALELEHVGVRRSPFATHITFRLVR
jgi:pimeloyl-ACP methyl ester carboxylesterase